MTTPISPTAPAKIAKRPLRIVRVTVSISKYAYADCSDSTQKAEANDRDDRNSYTKDFGFCEAVVLLTFDVEEHDRIEAAATLACTVEQKRIYADRMAVTTRQILALLAQYDAKATFFIVGQIALSHPDLVREIAAAGHEIGSHSHDHRRVHRFDPASFRADLMASKDSLEQVSGQAVVGFRAPTFSIMHETNWAIDVLAECGFAYDSSIFPIGGHDRYGVPDAPRTPFLAKGRERTILELPLATYRVLGKNLPVAGGGYFRLFPLTVMQRGIRQLSRSTRPPVSMLYFHPWEFDAGQPKLALGRVSKFRTYVGISKSMARLERLIVTQKANLTRAIDTVTAIRNSGVALQTFAV